jgi:hypothetical protein
VPNTQLFDPEMPFLGLFFEKGMQMNAKVYEQDKRAFLLIMDPNLT